MGDTLSLGSEIPKTCFSNCFKVLGKFCPLSFKFKWYETRRMADE